MPDYTPEQLAAVQARNDARAEKMARQLEILRQRATTCRAQYDDSKFVVSKTSVVEVCISIRLEEELRAIREKYNPGSDRDLEVRLNVHQDKPESWWVHVAGPWIRSPKVRTETVTNAIDEVMQEWCDSRFDGLKYDDYNDPCFTFNCAAKDEARLTAEFTAKLRQVTADFLALAELCRQEDVRDAAEGERRCDEHNAYMALPGAVFTESRRGGCDRDAPHYFDCVVKNPPTGRPQGRWGSKDGADQDDVLFKTREGPRVARQWLAKYLKDHPEIKAPKDLYAEEDCTEE
jgi:hypothetical protein